MSEETSITAITCADCGFLFGLNKPIVDIWRKSHKQFMCPNGHPLSCPAPSQQDKDLAAAREEVKKLSAKLTAALADAASQKNRADKLAEELEIWNPRKQG